MDAYISCQLSLQLIVWFSEESKAYLTGSILSALQSNLRTVIFLPTSFAKTPLIMKNSKKTFISERSSLFCFYETIEIL